MSMFDKIMFGCIVVLFVVIGLPVGARTEDQPWHRFTGDAENVIFKFTDGDIVCYVSDGYHSGGISCLKWR